jgi:hypothetical protein
MSRAALQLVRTDGATGKAPHASAAKVVLQIPFSQDYRRGIKSQKLLGSFQDDVAIGLLSRAKEGIAGLEHRMAMAAGDALAQVFHANLYPRESVVCART